MQSNHYQTFKRAFVIFLTALMVFSALPAPQAQIGRRPAPPQRADQGEKGDLSALHYATRQHRGASDEAEEHGEEATVKIEKDDDISSAWQNRMSSGPVAPHWNSPAGRAAAAEQLAIDLPGEKGDAAAEAASSKAVAFNIQSSCTTPDITLPGSGCCSYGIKDQLNNIDVAYRQPYHVFTMGTDSQREQQAQDFAATVRASMPMFLPYKNSHVFPGSGWIYDGGSFHGAIDFGRDNAQVGVDPTFGVYAVADGKVVTVLWDDLLGNTVVIEHKAPNGDRYRTAYMHLRDGFDHDLAQAQAMPSGDHYDANGKVIRQYKYYLFAHKANPNSLYWGTNSQTIQVNVGDTVYAGQFIAYSGNTGSGGAGNGLDDNGNPTNAATANNHLHLMTTVPDPRPSKPNDWIQVDPYGVYAQANTGCYDLLDNTQFARLFAPFYPSFHNVPIAVVSKYFGYYPGMGYALQTLSLHKNGNDLLASGSFQKNLPSQWKARLNMSGSDFQSWFDYYHDLGYRPREISVTHDFWGNPRYTVIWKKRNGEGYYTHFGLTDAEWSQKVTEHVTNGGMVLEEHVAYNTPSGARHAGVFISSPKPVTYEVHYLNYLGFVTLLAPLKAQGYKQTNIDIEEFGNGWYYGGIWRKVSGQWATEVNLTPQEYQSAFEDYSSQGYRLYRIQGYSDSDRFAAIWTK